MAVMSQKDAYLSLHRDWEQAIKDRQELMAALKDLVARCDGEEGVRADGSNIQTHKAHAILAKLGE